MAGQQELQPQSLAGYYTVSAPAGWTVEDLAAASGFIRRYVLTVAGTRKAALQLMCQPHNSVESMLSFAKGSVGGLGGTWDVSGQKPVTVAGLTGVQVDYDIPALADEEIRAVYLTGATCGWNIAMQSFGKGTRAQYAPLFDRILATFQPATAGG